MDLEADVKAFATESKIDPKVEGWLIGEGNLDCEGVATLAAREELLDSKFIQVMITKGVDAVKGNGKEIASTKCWRRCRTDLDEKTKPKPDKPEAPHATDQEIPAVDAATIIATWEHRQNFMLTHSQLLTPFQQGRLWREHNMTPSTITFMDAREMRTRAMVNMPKGSLVSYRARTNSRRSRGHRRLHRKGVRVVGAYPSVHDDNQLRIGPKARFVPLPVGRSCVRATARVHDGHIQRTQSGRGFPDWGWGTPSLFFADATRVQKEDPKDMLTDIGTWQHKWSWVPAPNVAAQHGAPPAGRPMPPQDEADNRQLQDKLDSMSGHVMGSQAVASREEKSGGRGGVRGTGLRDLWIDIRDQPPLKKGKGKSSKTGCKGGKQPFGQNQTPGGWKKKRGKHF